MITYFHDVCFNNFSIEKFAILNICLHYLSDYDALRALDSDNPPDVPSMTEEEINSLPAHKYKVLSAEGSNSGWKRQVHFILFF